MNKGYLVLQNGQIFEGTRFGAETSSIGELVFTTGMTGYVETLTDPSYAGQMILQTYPLIGNVGMIPSDYEGKCVIRGYVVREWCEHPSNFRAGETLDAFLKEEGIPGLCGVDTRQLTRIIREHGVMNAAICDETEVPKTPDALQALLNAIGSYAIHGAVDTVTCRESSFFPADAESSGKDSAQSENTPSGKSTARFHVAVIDYGSKHNIVRELNRRACDVTVYPAFTPAEEIFASRPDGVMLSNGPGDPADNPFAIEQIRKMLGKIPLFGICLGHQLTALAVGGKTYKMKYGHHGANQPVKEVLPENVNYPGNYAGNPSGNTGNYANMPNAGRYAGNTGGLATEVFYSHGEPARTYITSQNHGYAVDMDTLPAGRLSFVNANDGTCEGIDYPELSAFTVQFHPEAHGGPMDTAFLFDRFIRLMEQHPIMKGGV